VTSYDQTSLQLVERLAQLGRPFRLIVTGGGTGGHTYPALTAIRELQRRLADHGASLDVLWIGTSEGLEARVAAQEDIPFKAVPAGKLRRASNPLRMLNAQNLRDIPRVPAGAVKARSIVAKYGADVVLSTGGYVAVPVGLAAKLTRTPLIVHEQTVRLGLANRLLARIATTVAVSSGSTLKLLPRNAATVVTGNPVRPALFTGDRGKGVAALGLPGFDPDLPTVYITGGAQGSVQINTLVQANLPWLLTAANVVHQCGAHSLDQSRENAATLPDELRGRYWVNDYVGAELPDILALADVVISRSGAGTIAELTALGKPAVLIPYPSSAGNEQEHNARHLADADAAIALIKDKATAERLKESLQPILASADRRAHMAKQAASLGRPDAASRLVDVILAAGLRSQVG
jgi:UDP-N-acetylglucosamine--N-acetylmuramyl-(pentapeptide) pyrophosphoryl-undecaprenol N-acetylglucosamine transferase